MNFGPFFWNRPDSDSIQSTVHYNPYRDLPLPAETEVWRFDNNDTNTTAESEADYHYRQYMQRLNSSSTDRSLFPSHKSRDLTGCTQGTIYHTFPGLTAFGTTFTPVSPFVFDGTTLDGIMDALATGSSANVWMAGSVIKLQTSQGWYVGRTGTTQALSLVPGITQASSFTIILASSLGITTSNYLMRENNAQFVFSGFTLGVTGTLQLGTTGILPVANQVAFDFNAYPAVGMTSFIWGLGSGVTGLWNGTTQGMTLGMLTIRGTTLGAGGITTDGNTLDVFTFTFVNYPSLVLSDYLEADTGFQYRCCIQDFTFSQGLTQQICNNAGLTASDSTCDGIMICYCSASTAIGNVECACFNDYSVLNNNGMTGTTGITGPSGATMILNPACAGVNCIRNIGYRTEVMTTVGCTGVCTLIDALIQTTAQTQTQRQAAMTASFQAATCSRGLSSQDMTLIIVLSVLGALLITGLAVGLYYYFRNKKRKKAREGQVQRPAAPAARPAGTQVPPPPPPQTVSSGAQVGGSSLSLGSSINAPL